MKIKRNLKKYIAIASVLLAIVIFGIVGGSTYSKYLTKIDGEGSAEVARWSFTANNETTRIENIKLDNTYSETILKENTIAPGTSGNFDIVLDTTGADVAIDYKIEFENCTNKPTNLKFEYDGTVANTLEELQDVLKGRISLGDTKTLTIKWIWEYETGSTEEQITSNDLIDTNDAGKSFSFDVLITGTQVNPGESN